MKIICSGCGANHWLSDMQLSDGGCNVICPHCSTKNFVDASMIDPQSLEPRWYYAANNDSVGPLSTRDLEFTYLNGQITLDSYVWCDGLSDWMALGDVPEFSYLKSPIQGTPYGNNEATRVAGGGNVGGFPSYQAPAAYGGEETQALDISEEQRQSFANARPRGKYSAFGGGASGGMMGMDAQGAQDDEPVFGDMSDAPATSNAANDMIGARSENSVLFSLSSLQAVSASSAPDTSASVSGGSGGGGAGLIDVKALAASPAVARRRTNEVIDSFNGGDAVPMATVLPLGTKKDNTKLYIALAFASAIIIALIIAFAMILSSDKEEPVARQSAKLNEAVDQNLGIEADVVAANEKEKKEAEEKKAAEEKAKKEAEDAEAKKAEEEKKAAEEKKAEEEKKAAEEPEPKADTKKPEAKKDTKKKADKKSADTPKAEEKPAEAKKTETKKPEAKAEAPAPAAASNSIGKSDIQAAFRSAGAQIRTCARSSTVKGSMKVSFTIKGDGRVAGAKCVSPEFASSPAATCVIKVISGMKFKATGTDTPVNNYPVQIQ